MNNLVEAVANPRTMNEMLLFFGLFFPRISLWVAWLYGNIPPNTVPFGFEVFLTIFLPRGLMCFYIVTTLGWNSGWLIAHGIFWFFAVVMGLARASSK
jgi:hypothetical protein